MTHTDSQWVDIDPWWERVSREQTRDLDALESVLDELNEQWATSSCVYETDPLSTQWGTSGPNGGPLRTNQEENWSQWLAYLLGSAPERFYPDLFETALSGHPTQVRCEVEYSSDSAHDRRADIVLEFPQRGVSIEVKVDDEAYAKTPETAALIENRTPSLEWSHVLLLPFYRRGRLDTIMGDRLVEPDDDRPAIQSPELDQGGVKILYWDDVSFALRQALLGEECETAHWQASAYLFITHIELHLCRFYSRPILESRLQASSLGVTDITQVQSITPERQLEYLTACLDAIDTND